jgi:hypothetical protein
MSRHLQVNSQDENEVREEDNDFSCVSGIAPPNIDGTGQ